MLSFSQPLDSKGYEKITKNAEIEETEFADNKIKSQSIGKMFEDILDENGKRKVSLSLRLYWFWRDIKWLFYDVKYGIRNHIKWSKTMKKIRPWEGFDGLIHVMVTHLKDYIETEEKYGHAEEDYRKNKISTAKETVDLLEKMRDPGAYIDKRREEVKLRYPDYKVLNTEYINGSSSFSGDFIVQSKGWAGKEGGNNPRAGYFEFVNGRFELTKSPDQNETNIIILEIDRYRQDLSDAYKLANEDSDRDFERLGLLLKDNLYSWWD